MAYCVFSKPEGLQKALSLDLNAESAPRILSTEQHPIHVGVVSKSRDTWGPLNRTARATCGYCQKSRDMCSAHLIGSQLSYHAPDFVPHTFILIRNLLSIICSLFACMSKICMIHRSFCIADSKTEYVSMPSLIPIYSRRAKLSRYF